MRKMIFPVAIALSLSAPAMAQEEVVVEEVVAAPAPAAPAAAPAPAMRFVPSEVVQPAPPAAVPADGKYPPCKGKVQDNCINPRQDGLKYGNVPLDYWPGKPASEIKGPIPAQKPGN